MAPSVSTMYFASMYMLFAGFPLTIPRCCVTPTAQLAHGKVVTLAACEAVSDLGRTALVVLVLGTRCSLVHTRAWNSTRVPISSPLVMMKNAYF